MILVQLHEQIREDTCLAQKYVQELLPYIEEGENIIFSVNRGCNPRELCLSLCRKNDNIIATGSYFVGLDWVSIGNVAIQVNPKMNDGFEIDYIRMLNDALLEPENYDHLKDLVTIHFNKPSIRVQQQQDLLSVFLITEYINVLYKIVKKGLKKSFYIIEENLCSKVKGRILIGKNIRSNIVKGHVADNICKYQIYGIDSPENRILKKALSFCIKQLEVYKHIFNTAILDKKVRFIRPFFNNISDDVVIEMVKIHEENPVYRDYSQAIEFARLLLRRYSYDITVVGKKEITTPPFWIDMSKLFELYVFHHLRQVFNEKDEIRYHVKAHRQELDYLLNPGLWSNPYVIDAKYKPRYKESDSILKDDAREIAGYARLSSVYAQLRLGEDSTLPVKCLIIYPDQDKNEYFSFDRQNEPAFEKVSGYVRFYKLGIRLPVVHCPYSLL